jgi:hypothetical protein
MNERKKLCTMLMAICIALITSCSKDESNPTPATTPTPVPTVTESLKFTNLTFNPTTKAYFSTNGSMTTPVDSVQAMSISSSIDITFIFNYDYTQPGFFDPVARSQTWYWMGYYNTTLSNAVETRYYTTTLTKTQFDAAAGDESNIATYFASPSMVLAPHAIFPTGSCIGGSTTSNPNSVILSMGVVYGFKNTVSGKRGLLYVRTDQESFWPTPMFNFDTKVDLIREH